MMRVASLGATLCMLLLATGLAWRQRRRAGTDVVMSMLDGPILRRWPMLTGFLMWATVAFIGEVVVARGATAEYLATRHGLLALTTFPLLVPLDVGAYFWLRISARRFFDAAALADLGLAQKWSGVSLRGSPRVFVLHQGLSIAAALLIQHSAMSSEICSGIPHSPWISTPVPVAATSGVLPVRCPPPPHSGGQPEKPASEDLTSAGAVHYVFRGIGAYLAVNFVLTVLVVVAKTRFNLVIVDPARAFTLAPARKPKPVMRALGLSLLVAVLLGTLATVFEGIALFLIAWKVVTGQPGDVLQAIAATMEQNRKFLGIAQQSTWLFWLVMSLLLTGLATATIYRLQAILEAGKGALVQDAFGRLDAYGMGSSRAEYEGYWATVEAINASADRIDTSPVPALKKLVGSTVALQVLAFLPRIVTTLQGLVPK
jgi:hypothetical protein